MTEDIRTVRQWQSLYRAGAFEGKSLDDQWEAGWRDFSCHFDALPGRLRQIAPVVMGIEAAFVLDHYSVWFANVRCHGRNAAYDRVWFDPLDRTTKKLGFSVRHNSPEEPEKWALYTERFGSHAPEFGCGHVREMAGYINKMVPELEQGVKPPFLEEQAAAVRYVQGRDTLYPSGVVCRVGEHSYRFLDWNNRKKTVHVARRREDIPPAFQETGAVKIHGLYVFCPDDIEQPPPSRLETAKKSHKTVKERER